MKAGFCEQCGVRKVEGVCPACSLGAGQVVAGLGSRPLWEDLGEEGEEFRVIDQFALRRRIARGGMGEVYRARQLSTGREVALKWLYPGVSAERIRREISALAELDHPGIVKILHCGEHEGRAFLAMDLVEGMDAAERARVQPFTAEEAAECMEQVARAIAHAHQRGVLHRDLKPQNILIGADRIPRVTDFGLARRLDNATVTNPGERPGTPAYMAPEQVDSRLGHTTVATDVYGLGATLYHLLTGEAPFRASRPEAVYQLVLNATPVAPRALNPRIPAALEAICLKCLNKEPRRRYATAVEVAEELDRFLARKSTGWMEGWRPWTGRGVGVMAAGFAMMVLSVTGFLRFRHPPAGGARNVEVAVARLTNSAVPLAPVVGSNVFAFKHTELFMSELAGGVHPCVVRSGDTNLAVRVRLVTRGGTAVAGRDFMAPDRMLEFPAGVTEVIAGFPVWDNAETNRDRTIELELKDPTPSWGVGKGVATVTLLDNDEPGRVGVGVAGGVRVLLPVPDGRLVVSGGFNNLMGGPSFSLARFNRDGRIDPGWQPAGGPYGWINAMAVLAEGALFIAGDFTRYNDVPHARCLRFRPDGEIDSGFRCVPGPDDGIWAMAVQPDGRILIAGDFRTVSGVPCNRLARLHPDGSVDTSFRPGDALTVRGTGLALHTGGRILVFGGGFNQFGGFAANGLVRLEPDGSLDRSFQLSSGPAGPIDALDVLTDGRILIGGWFMRYRGANRPLVARLLPDGSLDEGYVPDWNPAGSLEPEWNANPSVLRLARQPEGALLVAGGFARVNGKRRGGLVRFRPDGGLDESFQHGPGADGLVQTVASLPDGRVVVAGGFKHFDGMESPGLVILEPDGRVPARTTIWQTWQKATGGNGHAYALTSRAGSRAEMEAEARESGAHLVTLDDPGEQTFVESTILVGTARLQSYWIGMQQQGKHWAWVTGRSAKFTRWAPGEPKVLEAGAAVLLNCSYASADPSDVPTFGLWSVVPDDGSVTELSGRIGPGAFRGSVLPSRF